MDGSKMLTWHATLVKEAIVSVWKVEGNLGKLLSITFKQTIKIGVFILRLAATRRILLT